jgi:hypothetical protein
VEIGGGTTMLCYQILAPYDLTRLADSHPDEFVNEKLNHECVEFVRQTTLAPSTKCWRPGAKVKGTAGIPAGAAIANFKGDKYLSHAAIYLDQDEKGIWVLDQWNKQGYVAKRQIKYPSIGSTKRLNPSNNGDLFYLIDPVLTNEAAKANHEPLTGRIVAA